MITEAETFNTTYTDCQWTTLIQFTARFSNTGIYCDALVYIINPFYCTMLS